MQSGTTELEWSDQGSESCSAGTELEYCSLIEQKETCEYHLTNVTLQALQGLLQFGVPFPMLNQTANIGALSSVQLGSLVGRDHLKLFVFASTSHS